MKRLSKLCTMTAIIIGIFLLSMYKCDVYAYTNINFRNITNEDGLSQVTVETIIQDKQGYIWIGTNDGLNRYNGYEFKVYRHSDEIENTISNNYIVDLQEDRKGYIWVGTANGLSKIDPKTQIIENYFTSEDKGNLSHYNIGDILITNSGDVLVGTSDGLNIYDEKNNRFERILENELSSQLIYTLAQDGNGDIWVATKEGLDKILVKEKKIIKFNSYSQENRISENSVYGLKYDGNGYIWAGTFREGLNKININTNDVTIYKNDSNDKNSLPGNYIRDITRDSFGGIWIATNQGLAKYNEKQEKFISYKNKIYDQNTLVGDEVFSIIEDNSGLIWVGTYSGISIFDPSNKIIHYKNDPFNNNSINENIIHGIYEDKDGLLWVGTNTKGINIIDRKNNTVSHLNIENSNNRLSNDSINDITGNGNEIYISTNNGLNIINKKENTIKVYKEEDGISDNNIKKLFLDSKGYLWMGTIDGVSILNTKDKSITDISPILESASVKDGYNGTIYEDKEGNYWIGCFLDGGLIKLNPKDNSVKVFKNIEKNSSSISSNTIRAIVEDDYGNLWIGTSNGLNKFDKEKEIFTRYTTKQGLANNIVYGILIDKYGNPWSSTNSGISKLDIKKKNFENFGITDGLQGNEFNGRAYHKTKNGEFIFGGINGFNIFTPEDMTKTEFTPRVGFDEFEVNGNKYSNIDGMSFNYDENFITIDVFLPDYKNNTNIQYDYILEGTNGEWTSTDTNLINYSNLSPGDYTFRIKAVGHNGIMSEESSVSFSIEPPFWKSDIALFIYLLIIIIVIYRYINRMKRLDTLVQNKTKQLQSEMNKNSDLLNKVITLEKNKNNYFINLSHELRTPLNVIYTSEQLITELNKSNNGIEKDKLNQYMEVVRRNTKRLLNLINNLIDGTKIDHGSYKINLEDNDIVYVVEEAALSLKEYVENKGIRLIIDPEIEEKIIKCDAYEIERCIVNLVSNSAKFTPKGGTIEVNIKEINERVEISVRDTGIGIDKKYHEAIFDRFNQVVDANSEVKGGSGLGLTITKHIIELHNGHIYVESEPNIGTKFTIIL
ncbi:histidine kinase [Romboutsia weinsteinii]|uniref:histidine kinase n=1 Tax=Romboutsia weinsteinii TaxID=2020949 RepID=A0A371J2Z8_9FIRM|nr:sensor histidine kinase [Romboutsia weinsteinii]RDY27159.1 histidine kinase [Romboutsia weinsteinii]